MTLKKKDPRKDDVKLKLLLYGKPGSEKTRTAGTAEMDERTVPALHVDIGGNTESLADRRDIPDILVATELGDLNAVYSFLARGQPANHQLVTNYGLTPGYKTIIIDGVTDLHRQALGHASGNITVEPASMPQGMELQHYKPSLWMMVNFASRFYRLPMHVIFTALEYQGYDKVQELPTFGPALAGQAAVEVAGWALNVGRMTHVARMPVSERKDVERKLGIGPTGAPLPGSKIDPAQIERPEAIVYFQPTSTTVAKDQMGMKVRYIVNPTVTKMLDLVERNRFKQEITDGDE